MTASSPYASRPGRRPTLGFLGYVWSGGYQYHIRLGLLEAGRHYSVNLFNFLIDQLGDEETDYHQGHLGLCSLIGPPNVDGLIVLAAGLSNYLSIPALQRFLEQLQPLPVVTIGLRLPPYPAVLIDNQTGVRESVAHLIEVHQCRRIAYLRGSALNNEAEARYAAYQDTLTRHGLAVDPQLVVPGHFSWEEARPAVEAFLARPELEFDALAAANDEMALNAQRILYAQGRLVPVVGFDDIEESALAMRPLTTVRQPMYQLGWQGVELLLARLRGEALPDELTLPSELIVRQSCGCLSQAASRAWVPEVTAGRAAPAAQPPTGRADLLRALAEVAPPHAQEPDWPARLLEAFEMDWHGQTEGRFLAYWDRLLMQSPDSFGEPSVWQDVLSVLRRRLWLEGQADPAAWARAENLWHPARVLASEVAQHFQANRRFQTELMAVALQNLSGQMAASFDIDQLFETVATGLPALGFKSFYLAMYDPPGLPSEWGRLVVAYDQAGPLPAARERRRFPARQLVPPDLLADDRHYVFVVVALFFKRTQLGWLLFEARPQRNVLYEALRAQISSALRGALLVQEMVQQAVAQDQLLAELSQANENLENEIAQRRRVAASLAESERAQATLLSNLPGMVYRCLDDANWTMEFVSEGCFNLTGYQPDHLIQNRTISFLSLIHPQDRVLARTVIETALAVRQPFQLTYRIIAADGKTKWVWEQGRGVFSAQGELVACEGFITDVTERKWTEDAMRRQATRLSLINQIGRQIASVLDLQTVLDIAARLVQESFGYQHAALFILDREHNELVMQAKAGIFAHLYPPNHRLKLGQGMVGWAGLHGRRRLTNDVTADAQYINLYPDRVPTRSELAIPIRAGEMVLGVLDVQSSERDAFAEQDVMVMETLADQIAIALENARLYEMERTHAEALEAAYQMLKENQEKMMLIDKMALLGRLTAGIAHEMNTPLAAVRAALAELAQLTEEYQQALPDLAAAADHQEIAQEMRRSIQLATRAAERAATYVRGIKTQTRDLSPIERTSFNVVAVIEDTLPLLNHALRQGRSHITFEHADEYIALEGVPSRLSQVITNLITNAIDANRAKGGGPITVQAHRRIDGVEVRVQDEGCGIPSENLAKIFDPMFTTKPFGEGTGLGLTIVHNIVVGEFGGVISVNSDLDRGTVFTLYFPAARLAAAAAEA